MTQRNGESLLDRTVSEETFDIVSPGKCWTPGRNPNGSYPTERKSSP